MSIIFNQYASTKKCCLNTHTHIVYIYIYIYIYIYRYIVCVCVCVRAHYVYTYNQSTVLGHPQICFLTLKVLFLKKQVKRHNGFIYYTKYKSFWAT